MRRHRKIQHVVGLDIEAGSVAATEVAANGRVEVVRTVVEPLRPGAWSEGEVADPEELAGALEQLFDSEGLSKHVRLGLANQGVAVRLLSLPLLDDDDEIATAIRFQAQDHIPMPLEDAVLDWQVLDQVRDDGDGAPRLHVIVAAARRAMVERMLGAVRDAGLRPVGVDIAAFGVVRALAGSHSSRSEALVPAEPGIDAPPPPPVLYCHLGDITNVAVARGSTCVFTRASTFGMEGIAQRLAERCGISLDESRERLLVVGLERSLEQAPGDPATAQVAREVLEEGVARLAEEMRMAIEYHAGQASSEPVNEVVVCGEGSTVPGLVDRLSTTLGRSIVSEPPPALASIEPAHAARLTLSYGLALEE